MKSRDENTLLAKDMEKYSVKRNITEMQTFHSLSDPYKTAIVEGVADHVLINLSYKDIYNFSQTTKYNNLLAQKTKALELAHQANHVFVNFQPSNEISACIDNTFDPFISIPNNNHSTGLLAGVILTVAGGGLVNNIGSEVAILKGLGISAGVGLTGGLAVIAASLCSMGLFAHRKYFIKSIPEELVKLKKELEDHYSSDNKQQP